MTRTPNVTWDREPTEMTGSVSITAWSVGSASIHQPWQQRPRCPLFFVATNSLPFAPSDQVPLWMLPMFLEQFTLFKMPLLHTYCVITPVFTGKWEKGCYTEEKSNTQVGNQLSLVSATERIMYKWLFFYREHVKSKFFPTSFQQSWIHFLSFAMLFCNFWQRNDVFEMECLMYSGD